MKKLIFILMLCVVSMTFGAYTTTDITSEIASNADMLSTYLRDVLANQTAFTYTYTPGGTPAAVSEGMVYYDSAANALKVSTDGSTFTTLEAGGAGTTLDGAYDFGGAGAGSKIVADSGTVEIEVTDNSNNTALLLDNDEATNNNETLVITNAGTGNSIDIEGTSGNDIEGTGDTWGVTTAGVGTFLSLVLETSETIINDTDHEIQFGDNGTDYEDISFVFGSNNNIIGLATDSGADTFEFGVIDDLTGVGSITFDNAASTITLTSTGATDLTISQATADQNASLILQSTGTGADALSLRTHTNEGSIKVDSADNIDIDAADNITIDLAGGSLTTTVTGGDYSVDITDKSYKLDSGEAHADAIWIIASNAAGGINMDCGTGTLDIDVAGAIDIANSTAVDISIDASAGSFNVDAGQAGVDDAIVIAVTGAASGMQITSLADIDITTTGASGEDIILDNNGGSIHLVADEAAATSITIFAENAAGGIDMDFGTGAMVLTGTGVAANLTIDVDALSFDFTDSSNITVTSSEGAEDLTISQIGANDSSIIITSAGTGANAVEITTSAATGDIDINSGDDITFTAVGKVTMELGAEASTYQGNFLPAGVIKQTVTTGALTTADCGFCNQVAIDAQTITLPATVAGVEFWIMNTAADDQSILTVDCDGADKFIGTGFTPADGEAIELTKVGGNYGDYIKVSAHTDGWIITEMVGVWAESAP